MIAFLNSHLISTSKTSCMLRSRLLSVHVRLYHGCSEWFPPKNWEMLRVAMTVAHW